MRRNLPIRILVPLGLALSLFANVWIELPAGRAPGLALHSETVLVVERSMALFIAWVVALVALAESWHGRLPLEVSGRGIRYAEAAATRAGTDHANTALAEVQLELGRQGQLIADLIEDRMQI